KETCEVWEICQLVSKNFILTLSTAQKNLLEYQEVYQNVLKEGTKRLGPNLFNLGALFAAMGLVERGNYDETQIENRRQVLKWAETTDSGITDKFTKVCKLALSTFAS